MKFRIAMAGLALSALGGVALAQQALTELSAERRTLMRQQIQSIRAIAPVVQASGDPRTAVTPAETLLATARRKLALFPPGSDLPDDRARPEIWSSRAEFEQEGQRLISSAEQLVAAARAGESAAFATAFRAATGVCESCHDRFRLPPR